MTGYKGMVLSRPVYRAPGKRVARPDFVSEGMRRRLPQSKQTIDDRLSSRPSVRGFGTNANVSGKHFRWVVRFWEALRGRQSFAFAVMAWARPRLQGDTQLRVMSEERSDTEHERYAPVVRELLQKLATKLSLDKKTSKPVIEQRIITEAARLMVPEGGPTKLAVGMTYEEWGRRCGADAGSIRTAFHWFARSVSDGERVGVLAEPKEDATGRLVPSELHVKRPGTQKNGAAGFEVRVLIGGEEVGASVRKGALVKRTTEATRLRAAAMSQLVGLGGYLRYETDFARLLAKIDLTRVKGSHVRLADFGAVSVILKFPGDAKKRIARVILLVVLGGATTLTAFPELAERVMRFLKGVLPERQRTAPPSPPRPITFPPPSGVLSAVLRPAPVAVPGRVLDLTRDPLGDVPSSKNFTLTPGLQPFLYLASDKACSRCVFFIAYPALWDSRPLQFSVDFGDGVTDSLRSDGAFRLQQLDLRRRGVFFLPEPLEWSNVFFAQSWHQYRDEDADYPVRVVVEALNGDGTATTLVTLLRRVRVESRGVVSTDVTITVPSPAPNLR